MHSGSGRQQEERDSGSEPCRAKPRERAAQLGADRHLRPGHRHPHPHCADHQPRKTGPQTAATANKYNMMMMMMMMPLTTLCQLTCTCLSGPTTT